MESVFTIVPAFLSPAERKRNERRRQRFMRRRALLRWVVKTFRIYRHVEL